MALVRSPVSNTATPPALASMLNPGSVLDADPLARRVPSGSMSTSWMLLVADTRALSIPPISNAAMWRGLFSAYMPPSSAEAAAERVPLEWMRISWMPLSVPFAATSAYAVPFTSNAATWAGAFSLS